jgi:hypothetical protein
MPLSSQSCIMKKAFLLAILGFSYCASYAQNTFPSTGRVGIGTSNPQVALDVNGGIRSSAESQFSLGNYLDPHTGVGYGIKIGAGGIAVNGNSTFLDGYVGIGITDTHGFRLAVNGNIRAQEIKVEAGPWPDYVFKPTYKLPSLATVKAYIDKNKHLPGIPSEIEVAKEGINLGEMNKLLLKKVEELTLYIIDLKKENQSIKRMQRQINSKLKHKINRESI